MKITLSELKQIIRQEVRNTSNYLTEADSSLISAIDAQKSILSKIILDFAEEDEEVKNAYYNLAGSLTTDQLPARNKKKMPKNIPAASKTFDKFNKFINAIKTSDKNYVIKHYEHSLVPHGSSYSKLQSMIHELRKLLKYFSYKIPEFSELFPQNISESSLRQLVRSELRRNKSRY
jgi:hypothetical protein